jgi:hypothetical protein
VPDPDDAAEQERLREQLAHQLNPRGETRITMGARWQLFVTVRSTQRLAGAVGTLQLSRALTDRRLSDDLLEQGVRNALAMINAENHA